MSRERDEKNKNAERQFVVIGAGPAGLTAAYELTKHGYRPTVLEQTDKIGGLSRTESYKGYYFDMGGHRFFTKAKEVEKLWWEILGEEFILRPRLSRIYYNKKFFYYPLKAVNALLGLGIWQAILIMLSYIRWQIFPHKQEETFEQWVTNRFGKRLFEIFFKTYTEKVWGISTSELKAEWAAQRIKDLSLRTALTSMFIKPGTKIKTLIEEFHYPRRGPGMLWEAAARAIETRGGIVAMNADVVRVHREGKRVCSVVVAANGTGEETIHGTDFISSMPVSEFVKRMSPVPSDVLHAAQKLHYRDFLTVCLIVDKPELFPDNWIYIHSPEVKVGRIQNFKNWSPEMVPDVNKTSLGLEYFCTEGDETWTMADADLIELGKREIEKIGLAKSADVQDGVVCRVPKAYPVYDSDYREYLGTVRQFVDGLENVQTIGRNGLHRYNNQDHAMLTGMYAVRNLVLGERNDLWNVNTDQEYHEQVREEPDVADVFKGALDQVFSRLDPVAMGLSVGTVSGVGLFLATLFLVIRGGMNVGLNLRLLDNFFPGYTVTLEGGFLGLVYAFITGFIGGWALAFLRNIAVYVGASVIRRDIQMHQLRKLLDWM
jgi:protoporphyrinogen oxidase